MFELIGLMVTGAATFLGFTQSRTFVAERLRFVEAVQKPSAPLIAGAVATAVAAPVVLLLPLVGAGTAILFGASVGIGTRAGARRIRRGLYPGRA